MQPIPEVAVEGTTVIIPIPGNYEVGYGTKMVSGPPSLAATAGANVTGPALTTGNTALEDFQRGELLLTLMQYNAGTGGYDPVVNLPVRYVASVSADPGSDRGRTYLPTENRQNALVVEIPVLRDNGSPTCPAAPCSLVGDGDPPVDFQIRVRRFRRNNFASNATSYVEMKQSFFDLTENPNSFIDSEWYGWGQDNPSAYLPTNFIPIKIADSPASQNVESVAANLNYTKFEYWQAFNVGASIYGGGWAGIYKYNISGTQQLQPRPDPEFIVKVSPYMGALSLSLNYPAHLIRITNVRLLRANTPGGWVSYTTTPATIPACSAGPSGNTGTLKVDVADPQSATWGVIVSYKLATGFAGCAYAAPLRPTDLTNLSIVGYTVNGEVYPSATAEAPSGPDFEDL